MERQTHNIINSYVFPFPFRPRLLKSHSGPFLYTPPPFPSPLTFLGHPSSHPSTLDMHRLARLPPPYPTRSPSVTLGMLVMQNLPFSPFCSHSPSFAPSSLSFPPLSISLFDIYTSTSTPALPHTSTLTHTHEFDLVLSHPLLHLHPFFSNAAL